tara:strand:- start:779 stop:1393 length:615 start_codon:yes stop_codon:yes gene_type:complete
MIKLLGKVPRKIYVACSGGSDSIAALDFLRRGNRDVSACYFDHVTDHSPVACDAVSSYCSEHGLSLTLGSCKRTKSKGESWEEYWRNERLDFFHSLDAPVVTGHTLDDVCEWWVFTSLTGVPRLIPYAHKNVIRPFMLTPKADMVSWCEKKGIKFVEDPSNFSDKYMRSFIRKNMMPHALYVNPGFYKVMRKKLIDETSHLGSV